MSNDLAKAILDFHDSTFLLLDDQIFQMIGIHLDVANLVFIVIFFGLGRLLGRMMMLAGLLQITTIMILIFFSPLYVSGMHESLALAVCLGLFSQNIPHYMNFLGRLSQRLFGIQHNPIYAEFDMDLNARAEEIDDEPSVNYEKVTETDDNDEISFGKKMKPDESIIKLSVHDKQCLKMLELGVDKLPELTELKIAFRKLSIKHHPDMNGGDTAHFIRLKQSYTYIAEKLP